MVNWSSIPAVAILGCALLISGCGGHSSGGTAPGPTPTATTAPGIYLSANNALSVDGIPTIDRFAKDGTGTMATALSLPKGTHMGGIAIDKAGRIYVGTGTDSLDVTGHTQTISRVLVYDAGANGSAKPVKTIEIGSASGPLYLLAVDAALNLYTTDNLSPPGIEVVWCIVEYSPSAGGTYVRTRAIGGALTQIGAVKQIAIDTAGNIYAGGAATSGNGIYDAVLVFSPTANGNVAPDATLTPTLPNGGLLMNGIQGVAVDSAGDIYVGIGASLMAPGQDMVYVFAPGSAGNATPVRTINGYDDDVNYGTKITLDSQGFLYVLNGKQILKFAPDAAGKAAPLASISQATNTGGYESLAVF